VKNCTGVSVSIPTPPGFTGRKDEGLAEEWHLISKRENSLFCLVFTPTTHVKIKSTKCHYTKSRLNSVSWALWCISVIPAMWEAEVGRSWSKADVGKNIICYLKITKKKQKMAGGLDQG
jgi:hypothetical protein